MVIVILSPFSEALLDGQLHPLLHAVDVVVVHHQVPVDQDHLDEHLASYEYAHPMSGIDNCMVVRMNFVLIGNVISFKLHWPHETYNRQSWYKTFAEFVFLVCYCSNLMLC